MKPFFLYRGRNLVVGIVGGFGRVRVAWGGRVGLELEEG